MSKELNEQQKAVLLEGQTEAPGSGRLLQNKDTGMYSCAACGNLLFDSSHKFDSHSGWPSFYDVAKGGSVELTEDTSHGMVRTEVKCSKCDGHLGHIFNDALDMPTGKRYCINSAAMKFKGEDGREIDG